MDETRDVIIGGMKGCERLLSLSKDIGYLRWKPLHMAGEFNSRNKMRSKGTWFKGRKEVDPPSMQDRMSGEGSSGRLDMEEEEKLGIGIPEDPEISNRSRLEGSIEKRKVPVQLDANPVEKSGCSKRMERGEKRRGVKGKKIGTNRKVIILVGMKK